MEGSILDAHPLPQELLDHVVLLPPSTVMVSDLVAGTVGWLAWLDEIEVLGITLTIEVAEAARIERLKGQMASSSLLTPDSEVQGWVVEMLRAAASAEATDVHLTTQGLHGEVEWRIHGDIRRQPPMSREKADLMVRTVMNSMAVDGMTGYSEHDMQDASITRPEYLPAGIAGIRIARAPVQGGQKMAFRLLPAHSDTISGSMEERLTTLGFEKSQVEHFESIMRRPRGILLIAGVTNSGKTTTIKHLLESYTAEHPEQNIVSVEDPVEQPIAGVKQQSVNKSRYQSLDDAFNANISFMLRNDPDRAFIGELRDAETIKMAIKATRTGHPIISTIHAGRWYSVIERLADEYRGHVTHKTEEYLSRVELFSGFAYQVLTKRLCDNCSLPANDHLDTLKPSVRKGLLRLVGESRMAEVRVQNPRGCSACNYLGTTNRTAIAEVVPTNSELMKKIRYGGVEEGMRYWKEHMEGMSVYDHARIKLLRGEIDPSATATVLGDLDDEIRVFEREAAL